MKEELDFHIECECGVSVGVKKTDAGGTVVCKCGNQLNVPTLSKLRRNIGLEGIEKSAGEKILSKIESGDLPSNQCVVCRVGNASTTVRVFAECERSVTKTSGGFDWTIFLSTLLLPLTYFSWSEEQHETRGRDTVIPVPLGFCQSCHRRIPRFWHFAPLKYLRILLAIGFIITLVTGHYIWPYLLGGFLGLGVLEFGLRIWNQSNCKSLMKNDDDYSELLVEFPNANIVD